MTTEASTDAKLTSDPTLTTDATLKAIIAEQEEIFVRRQPKSRHDARFDTSGDGDTDSRANRDSLGSGQPVRGGR